ncbi:hypothetical protein BKA62DRAFT_692126 [Auriculariales sp. MPI-PUGE-AT-0066]|nr:hypothetical protein BKA62DRAFT_692126 [Auriculariales sp. MPI-PUGE-AT-0066]
MRFILDTAVAQAAALNRTAVLPSFVYARACELPIEVCASFLTMVNRGDALHKDEWRKLPLEQQMGWKLPLGLMIDLPKLRQRHNVLLVSEYLRLHGLGPDLESSTGKWDREAYHSGPQHPSLYILEGEYSDPAGQLLVDTLPKDSIRRNSVNSKTKSKLEQAGKMHEGYRLPWDEVQLLLGKRKSDDQLGAELEELGWVVVHSFVTLPPQDLFKIPVYPIQQAAPRAKLRSWAEHYGEVQENVFLYAGETHLSRKPGGMWFTTVTARDNFARLVLHDMAYLEQVQELSRILEARMRMHVNGRMFFAAHMRRGDFTTLGWSLEPSLDQHLESLRSRFTAGLKILRQVRRGNFNKLYIYNIPDVEPDGSLLQRELPLRGDPYFLMTDARASADLQYLRDNGAVLVQDLLLPEDRKMFGWPIVFTDVLALVEQAMAARSDYFVGQAFSSVAGGVVGLRAGRGMDPRTATLIGLN